MCEAFVDTTGGLQPGETSQSHWIRWERHPELAERYEWFTTDRACMEQNPAGYHCERPHDHDEGHVFTVL